MRKYFKLRTLATYMYIFLSSTNSEITLSTYLNLLMDQMFVAPCLLSFTAMATTGPRSRPKPLSEDSRAWVSRTSPASMSTSVPVAMEKGRGE